VRAIKAYRFLRKSAAYSSAVRFSISTSIAVLLKAAKNCL
jgi:hypothetical protein